MADAAAVQEAIRDVRTVLDQAAETLLSLAEHGASLTREAPPDAIALEAIFVAMLQACAFQDLAGQRLDRLSATFAGRTDDRRDAHLLNGAASDGLGQGEADRLLGAG